MKKWFSKINFESGLSAIELVVVIGIFGIVASTVLFNFGTFRTNIHLQNLSQDVALLVKKAQTDTLAGLTPILGDTQTVQDTNWTPSYGIRFETDSADGPTEASTRILYYFDRNTSAIADQLDSDHGNYIYDGADNCASLGDSECLDLIQIQGGEFISEICANTVDGEDTCDSQDLVDIVFVRPDPTPYITFEEGDNTITASDVQITLQSEEGRTRTVTIFASGLLSVN
jgi:type II secretory pathway pseudopilin PulG